jgi:hypothetical protein
MKKLLILAALFVSTMLQAQTTSFIYRFDNPEVKINAALQQIVFENTLQQAKPGEPLLPFKSVNLLIPPGHEAVNITVTGSDEITLPGFFKLQPAGFARPLSEPGFPVFSENSEIYESNKDYPAKFHGQLSTHFQNGYAYAQTVITPVIYNPAEGSIRYYQTLTVTLQTRETTKGREALKNLSYSANINRAALKNAQNQEVTALYPHQSSRASTNDYQILIITPQSFSASLEPLVQLYLPRGLKTQIATTEFIQANASGADMPEKIRNYITDQYQNRGIEHVVLAGDVEHVPYRGFYCSVQSSSVYTDNNIPSDLYYSALDGNWNTNGNNLWGEIGEDDLLPEISVGRMSFSNTTELAAMLNKTTRYQNQPVTGELRNPLLAGENLYYNPDTWGSDYLELLIGTRSDNGYTTTGIPENHNFERLYDEESEWDKYTLMNSINAGRNFVHHVGHANQDYVMKFNIWDITNSNFSGVNGITHNFPVVYTHGCICGAFDVSDCIAEKMVSIDNFAAAFVGNSRYGWFNEGQTEGPSAHIHREFTDALFTDSLNRIGRAHMESKAATAPWVNAPGQWEEGALRWCFYDCNVLGDPVMAVWTNEPLPIATTYPGTITTGASQFEVTVTTGGQPAGGLTAVLLMNGMLYGVGTTNSSGVATVVIDPIITTPGDAQLVISGYNCLPVYYPVNIVSGSTPYVVYQNHEINDATGNNNGQADYGETISLELTLQNIGMEVAADVQASISTNDSFIIITDNTEAFGTIEAGGTSTREGFSFEIASDIPDNHVVEFTVTATSGDESWLSAFQINVAAPAMEAGSAVINDDSGNNNHIPDPGETFSLNITVLNEGHAASQELTASVSCNSSFVSIPGPNAGPAVVDALSQHIFAFENMQLSPETPQGLPLIFTFSLMQGTQTVLQQEYAWVAGQIIEDFESGNFLTHPWQHAGNVNWSVTDAISYEQKYSARSGNISHNQVSQLLVNYKVIANDSISFYLKVSSEQDYDFLMFYINDVKQGQWSGEVDWTRMSFPVSAGENSFKWVYSKDMSATSGQDAAWLDYIIFPPVETGVGIEDVAVPSNHWTIYPNPASSVLNILPEKQVNGKAEFLLLDTQGRVIHNWSKSSVNKHHQFNVSGITPGIYILRIITKTSESSYRIVIN